MLNDLEGVFGNSTDMTVSSDPFATYSNMIYPKRIRDVFDWSEFLWLRHGIYTQAIKRSVRYFLTRVELSGPELGYETRREYEERLMRDFNIMDLLASIGDDYLGFGNSFSSVSLPIDRMLICPTKGCGLSRSLRNMDEDAYRFTNYEFVGTCPQCRKEVTFIRNDGRSADRERMLNIVRWPPRDMRIDYNPITGECDYYLAIRADLKARVNNGDPMVLRGIPWPFVEAIKKDVNLKMNSSTFKHIRNEVCAQMTMTMGGYGLPAFMANFSQVVQLQILEKFNEAIADSAIAPLRLLTPAASPGGIDPLRSFNGQQFSSAVRMMLESHKKNPTGWHQLPVPLAYDVYGGDAKSLVPVELIDRALDNLLSSMGIPSEMYRGSLTIGGPPIGLRMFEKTWVHHVASLESWLNWFLNQCQELLMWKEVSGRLVRVSVAEDDMTKQVKLNLAASRVISNGTALRAFGIDPDYERTRMQEEDRENQEQAREDAAESEKTEMLGEYMQAAPPGAIPPNASQAGMGMPADGSQPQGNIPPMPPGAPGSAQMPPTGNPSLDDVIGQAQQIAQQLMTAPSNIRRSELTNLKKTKPELHALVKQELANMEQGIQSDALAQAKQPQPPM